MSKSLNKLTIIGNLGSDPEIRVTKGGKKVANFSVATNEKWTDSAGNQQEHTEWHRVVFFGAVAEVAEKYLNKGSSVYIEGSLNTEKWQDKSGNDRYTTSVRGRDLIMLSGKSENVGNVVTDYSSDKTHAAPPAMELTDDDIPF